MKQLRLYATLALVGASALACGGDSTAPKNVVGVYALHSINGSALPVIVDQDASGTLEVTGGTISLNTDQTFSDRIDYRFTASGGGVTTTQDIATGTYTRTGNTVTLSPTGDTPYSLVWDGDALTQSFTDFTLVYRR